jgi:hypothetical protein
MAVNCQREFSVSVTRSGAYFDFNMMASKFLLHDGAFKSSCLVIYEAVCV